MIIKTVNQLLAKVVSGSNYDPRVCVCVCVCVCAHSEWANDEVLFYTTQEGLRCSRVFSLDLKSPAATPRPVFEDTKPE